MTLAATAAMTGPAKAQTPQDDARRQEKRASVGDIAAMRRVGIIYATGRGVAKNPQKAFLWMSRAARAGDAEAMYDLSRFYQRGVGVAPNEVLARQWLKKSEGAGFSPKPADTAKKPTEARPDASKNLQLSFQKYERAAAAGDAGAMAELGHLYLQGQGTPRDVVKAAEMFRKGSDAGNRRCTHELAVCYATGRGVPQDWDKAFALFKRGADANDPASMHDLGICYYYGKGTPADRAEAQKWLIKSAKAGYHPSNQALASLARPSRASAPGRGGVSPDQARAAIGMLWLFSQMSGPSAGPSDEQKEGDEQFKRYIQQQREVQRAETDARIRARERGEN